MKEYIYWVMYSTKDTTIERQPTPLSFTEQIQLWNMTFLTAINSIIWCSAIVQGPLATKVETFFCIKITIVKLSKSFIIWWLNKTERDEIFIYRFDNN